MLPARPHLLPGVQRSRRAELEIGSGTAASSAVGWHHRVALPAARPL